MEKQDNELARRISDAYLDFTMAATAFAEKMSAKMFGQEIPQILLIHANDLNARYLEEMLKRLVARGYRFITLDEAMRHPAYQTKDTFVTKSGPTWLWRWNKSLGLNLSFDEDPEMPPWVNDLFNQWNAAHPPRIGP